MNLFHPPNAKKPAPGRFVVFLQCELCGAVPRVALRLACGVISAQPIGPLRRFLCVRTVCPGRTGCMRLAALLVSRRLQARAMLDHGFSGLKSIY
jgi:hypothetical protein